MSFLTSVCLSVLAAPSNPTPVVQEPLLGAVPRDAVVCVSVRDIDGLRASWNDNAWHKLYADEALAPLRAEIERLWEQAESQTTTAIDFDALLDALHGSMVAYLAFSESSPEPQFGYLIDPGSSADAARALYKKAIDSPQLKATKRSETYKGVELHYAAHEVHESIGDIAAGAAALPGAERSDGDAGPRGDSLVLFDTGRVFGFLFADDGTDLSASAHGVIDRLQGADANASFAAGATLADARKSVGAPGRVEVFVDIRNAFAAAMRDEKPDEEEMKILDALGVPQLTWAYLTADVGAGEKARVEGSLHLPAKGYIRTFLDCFGRCPRDLARAMPKESSTVALYGLDFPKLWASIWSLVKEVDPKAHDEARAQLTGLTSMFGDVENDLLLQMTGRWAMFSVVVPADEWSQGIGAKSLGAEVSGGPLYGEAYLIELGDSAKFQKTLQAILAAMQMDTKLAAQDFHGAEITTLAGDDLPIEVQWAFRPKLLVLSSYPTALRAALTTLGADAKDSALESARFQPLFDAYADSFSLGLASTADSVRGALNAFGALKPLLMMQLGENPLTMLPSGDVADRHFKGTFVSAVRKTGDTLKLEVSMR